MCVDFASLIKTKRRLFKKISPKRRVWYTEIENVTTLDYLGDVIKEAIGRQDYKRRISRAQGVFNTLNRIWPLKGISRKPKLRIHGTTIKSYFMVARPSD